MGKQTEQVVSSTDAAVSVEMFPVLTEHLSSLTSWAIDAPQENLTAIGQKLAHRFRIMQGGTWLWAQFSLVTEARVQQEDLMVLLRQLWQEGNEVFRSVRGIKHVVNFSPEAQTLANFVAIGVYSSLERQIEISLRPYSKTIRSATIYRDCKVQGWVIDEKPHISITVNSHPISSMKLPTYLKQEVHGMKDIEGLQVAAGSMKGEITGIVGPLKDYRFDLMLKSTRESMKKLLQEAPDDELVVHVKPFSGGHGYDYTSSALRIIPSPAQYDRLQIDGQEALAALQISPEPRKKMVADIAKLFANLSYIRVEPYSQANAPEHFILMPDKSLGLKARLGGNLTCECTSQAVLNTLRAKKLVYRRADNMAPGSALRVGVLNLIGNNSKGAEYVAAIRTAMADVGFPVEFIQPAERPSAKSFMDMQEAIDRLALHKPHLILVFLPGEPNDGEGNAVGSLYFSLKRILITKGLNNQMIYQRTLGNEYALNNIVLGILAKTGTIPFILDQPLPYSDLFVGLDIARMKNERSKGSQNAAAMTRIYAANGDFLKYHIVDGAMEGETLTREMIRKLFATKEFAGKRCVVHRDGFFRGNEKGELREVANEIGATFYLIEVIKSNVPRLYLNKYGTVTRPDKGTAFILSDKQAFLVSSLGPSKTSTPRPLQIRTDGDLPIEDALHSILALTHLHVGSIAMPRLPVTLHYSDQIGYLLVRGVRPPNNEGSDMFWV